MTRKLREPHGHTCLRYLSLAIGEAQIGRGPEALRKIIAQALRMLVESKWEGRKR